MRPRGKVAASASVLALAVFAGTVLAPAGGAAKLKAPKEVVTQTVTKQVGQAIPDGVVGTNGVLKSSLTVGKKLKGRTVSDVNLTFKTTGSAVGSANDLRLFLTAPNGTTAILDLGMIGQSIGPLTLDDETSVEACNDPTPPCFDPDRTLLQPYAGRATPKALFRFDGIPASGVWTAKFLDVGAGNTSVLDSWSLQVAGARPPVIKGKKRPPLDVTNSVAVPIPDAVADVDGQIRQTVTAGKAYKGATIGDVNVTLKTTGSAPTAADNIRMKLTSPRGNTAELIGRSIPSGLPGQSVGPLTFDDETPLRLCFDATPPCSEPDFLSIPFAGTAHPSGFLSDLDGGPIQGTWTLTMRDGLANDTSTLDSWRLVVVPRVGRKK